MPTAIRWTWINSKSGNRNGRCPSTQTSVKLSALPTRRVPFAGSDYFIHNQKLTLRTETKYLGMTISSDLSWSIHADNVTKKANSTMGFLKRSI